jgi:hypothetical protein
MKHIIFLLFIIATLISSLYGQVVTLSPSNGATAGGTPVSITGNPSFGSITSNSVSFGPNAVVCGNFGSTLNCLSPAGTGTVTVSITVDGTLYGATGTYLYQDITGVSSTPLIGPSAGGTLVTVTNTNAGFIMAGANNLECSFGGHNENANFISTSKVTCPSFGPGTSGTSVNLQISNNGNDFFPSNPTPQKFLYNDITVTSTNPSSGSTLGGDTITVTGTGFLMGYTPACMFGANTVTATVTSATTATCVSPSGTGGVSFKYSENGVDFVSGLTYTYIALSVTSLSPATGPTAGGTVLTLTGVGFTSVSTPKCQFGATLVAATVTSTTTATCPAPIHVAGSVAVTYSNDATNFVAAGNFIYADYTLTSITPTNGPTVGGTTVTLTGTGFSSIGTPKCQFGTTAVLATVPTGQSTSATCTSPGPITGSIVVQFANDAQSFVGTPTFLYINPTVTSFAPVNGPTTGGTTVTLTGTGFVMGNAFCQFGASTPVTATVTSATSATCVSPAGNGGVSLQYSNNGQTYVASNTFNYLTSTLTSISPTTGPVAGGTTVTLTGTEFAGLTPKCKFGTNIVTATITSTTTATCMAPLGTAGNSAVTYSNDGITFDAGTPNYLYQDITVTSISPNNGPVAGGTTVTVTGTGFTGISTPTCQFGSTSVPANFMSATTATCVAPVGTAGSQAFSYSNNAQNFVTPGSYLYQDITVGGISPNNGIPAGGTVVTVTGTGFVNSANLMCQFAGTSVPATFISATSLSCVAPAGAGNATFAVSNNAQTYVNGGSYLYQAAPTATSISPSSGNPGTVVTVTGGTYISTGTLTCKFGNTTVAATFVSATMVTCVVPAGSGNVSVATSDNGQDYGPPTNFLFNILPSAISPTNGKSAGFTITVITGSGFVNSASLSCKFGANVVSATFINSTDIQCATPAGTNGQLVTVQVSNDGVTFLGTLNYTYQDLTLSTVNLNNGKSAGNTPLTITATSFITGNIQCRFSGIIVASVAATFVSASSVTLSTPMGFQNGEQVTVQCTNNDADYSTNNLNFRFQDIKTTQLTPTSGAKNGGTTVSLTTNNQNIVTPGGVVQCRFGAATNAALATASSLTANSCNCATPSGLSGTTPEVYITDNGVDFFDTGFTFAFNDAFRTIQYSVTIIVIALVAIFIL